MFKKGVKMTKNDDKNKRITVKNDVKYSLNGYDILVFKAGVYLKHEIPEIVLKVIGDW